MLRAQASESLFGETPVFSRLFGADLLVRSGYQVGKSPVLPVFAAGLGAGEALLGVIVSVSVMTGLLLKPLVGVFSDRWGRRAWLLAGTAIFAGVPFAYRWIEAPAHLLALRLVHGLATAIYGPVTVAYVAELSSARVGERLGWFGMSRTMGYVVGPALGGWLLTVSDPVAIYDAIGLAAALAFVPVLLLPTIEPARAAGPRPSLVRHVTEAIGAGARTPAVWLAGGLDAAGYVVLYALKTFLPVYALTSGLSIAAAGALLSLQEGVHLALRPLGGRFADRWGARPAVVAGMAGIGAATALLPLASGPVTLTLPFVVNGLGLALVGPATLALLAQRVSPGHLGACVGLAGTLRNAGKVVGPIVGGLLVAGLGYAGSVVTLGVALVAGAGLVALRPAEEARPSG